MALQLPALTPLGLVGTSVRLQPQKLDFFHSKMEPNHLVVNEASAVVTRGW